ncbi:MAG TPA: hypothetical protein VIF62_19790 [Labilithrix sp.]
MRRLLAAAAIALVPAVAHAEDAQLPYEVPRETLIPGTPGMAGGFHVMLNGFAQVQNAGIGPYRISNANVKSWNGGATYPLVTDDWLMGYGRDSGGWVEGLVMLNFEPLTVGGAGYPEIGQSGEGLWDAQHAHQLLHQAMIAVHPLAGAKDPSRDLSLFAGQGSATIGPPIFMHRASNPGPTVPRKHHKGENPHETVPVIGASMHVNDTWIEASVFGDEELTPADSRFYPHLSPPASFAARLRQDVSRLVELQISGERLRNQGHGEPDAFQASASAYAYGIVNAWRLDALLDWAIDVPDHERAAQGALLEVAARTPDRRTTMWLRSELDQREEPSGAVSSPWFFETLGFERVVIGGETSGLQLGLFAESTLVAIPESLQAQYGTSVAVTMNAGVHVFGMWMLDGDLSRMHHHHMP